MAEPKLPESGIAQGSNVWKQTADEMASVVREYDNYLIRLAKHNKEANANVQVSGRLLLQLEKLRKTMIELRTAQGAWAKGAEDLVNKLQSSGGVTAAVTRLTGAIPKLVSEVDTTTGKMNILGTSTDMVAGKFLGYVAIIQAVAGALTKLIEKQDQARAAQGRLIREFGAINGVSISTPYTARAAGYGIAGTAGKNAAENLLKTVAGMRGGVGNTFIPEKGGDVTQGDFGNLVRLTAGGSEKVPEYLMKARQIFAMQPNKQMGATLENAMATEWKSGMPLDQLTESVLALGQEFVNVGMTVDESITMLGSFADAVGKAGLPMQVVIDLARQAKSELTTGAGITGMAKVAHFATQNFSELLPGTREAFNTASQKLYGKDYLQLSFGQKLNTADEMGPDYMKARLDVAYKAVKGVTQGSGDMAQQINKMAAESMMNLPWLEIVQGFTKGTNRTGGLWAGGELTDTDKEGFKTQVVVAAELQKGFFDNLNAAFESFYGSVQEFGILISGRGSADIRKRVIYDMTMDKISGLVSQGKTSDEIAGILGPEVDLNAMADQQRALEKKNFILGSLTGGIGGLGAFDYGENSMTLNIDENHYIRLTGSVEKMNNMPVKSKVNKGQGSAAGATGQ